MSKGQPPVNVAPLQKAPTHAITSNNDGTFSLVHSDTGRTAVTCADLTTAMKEKTRLDAVAATEKF